MPRPLRTKSGFAGETMIIRQETPQDYDAVYKMVKASFATASCSDGTEADYLNNLRTKEYFVPELSLLAVENNITVGQIVLYRTPIQLPDKTLTELVISPLSVHPDYFRRGIATALVNAGITQAQKMGYKAAFLCGEPAFYQKLGFVATYNYGIYHVKDKLAAWCMVKELASGFLNAFSGTVSTVNIE